MSKLNCNQQQTMGQGQSKYTVTNLPSSSEWELQKNIGYCELVKNKRTGEQMERYKLIKRNMLIDEELQFYEYRKNQNANLVKVVYVEEGRRAGICNGEDFYNVYSQRIPLRLSQIENLSFDESLMIIREALTGFDTIKDSYEGCLKISDEMIGFTAEGRVKIWVNQSFYVNSPEEHTVLKGVTYESDPTVTVAQIFHIVQEHLQNKMFPEDFTKRLQSQETRLDYQRAKTFIRNYSIENNIMIPERLSMWKHVSQFKRESLRIQIPEPELKQATSARSIKIIPEASSLSPRKQFNKILVPNNINVGQVPKVNFIYQPSQYHQNIQNAQNCPEHFCAKPSLNSSKKQVSSQQSIVESNPAYPSFIPKQIQRINSEYIYYQQPIPSPKAGPISSSSRKQLQPLNVFNQTHEEQKSRVSQYLSEEANTLNQKIQRLTINVQKEIESNMGIVKPNKMGYYEYYLSES